VVKNVKIIHKWFKMSKLYTSGLKCQNYTHVVKNGKFIHKWLKMSKLYTSG